MLKLKPITRIENKESEDDPDEIETAFQRFRHEVLAMARVRHPNVLSIFDYGSTVVQ
jgi:hypothetical protein